MAILNIISKDINITALHLSQVLNVSLSTIRRDIRVLNRMRILIFAGSSKLGHWEILRDIK